MFGIYKIHSDVETNPHTATGNENLLIAEHGRHSNYSGKGHHRYNPFASG